MELPDRRTAAVGMVIAAAILMAAIVGAINTDPATRAGTLQGAVTAAATPTVIALALVVGATYWVLTERL